MLGWVGILSVLAGLEAPTRDAAEPARTWLPPIGPRAIALLLLLLSVAPLAVVANAVDRGTSYIYEHTPIWERPFFEEGLVGTILCLVLWIAAALLLFLPRRLARRLKD
jgi:hypothetical protein